MEGLKETRRLSERSGGQMSMQLAFLRYVVPFVLVGVGLSLTGKSW